MKVVLFPKAPFWIRGRGTLRWGEQSQKPRRAALSDTQHCRWMAGAFSFLNETFLGKSQPKRHQEMSREKILCQWIQRRIVESPKLWKCREGGLEQLKQPREVRGGMRSQEQPLKAGTPQTTQISAPSSSSSWGDEFLQCKWAKIPFNREKKNQLTGQY